MVLMKRLFSAHSLLTILFSAAIAFGSVQGVLAQSSTPQPAAPDPNPPAPHAAPLAPNGAPAPIAPQTPKPSTTDSSSPSTTPPVNITPPPLGPNGAPAPRFDQFGAPYAPRLIAETLAKRNGTASQTSEDEHEVGTVSKDGSHQGVKLHGHWVIDVRNPDGTLTGHRDFENALESSAQGFLIGLMSGYMVPGDYMIVLGAQSGNGPCVATYQFCGIARSLSTYPALGYCANYYCTGGSLSYTYNFGTSFGGPFSLVLSGSITSNQTGTVGIVYSLLNLCANNASGGANPSTVETSSPSSCITQTSPATWYGPLSDANITPVSVTSGQIIQVTVTITFS